MSSKTIRLYTERLFIRTIKKSDAAVYLKYLKINRKFFEPWRPSVAEGFFTRQSQLLLIEEALNEMEMERKYKFLVFDQNDHQKVIGDFTFSNVVRGNFQSCFLGYQMDEDFNNKGLMTEALQSGIDFAFDQLKLHRVEANIMPRNKNSIRVAEKLGFAQEGLSRKYLKIHGAWEDHLCFTKLNPTAE